MVRLVRSPFAPAGLLLAVTPLAALAQQSLDDLSPDEAQSLRGAISESLYRIEPASDGLFVAPNPAQEMRSAFGPCGIEVRGPGWSVSLALEAWGREGAMLAVEDAELRVDDRRVEYRRGGLTEWYVNEARGLEQGFTIEGAPAGEGALALVLSVEGDDDELSVEVLPGGRDARFTVVETGAVLHYTGLRAWDANGRELAASLLSEGRRLLIEVEDEGAVYPLVVDPWITTELAKLTATDASTSDEFGYSVAVSGDTAVVGAWEDDHAGGSNAGSAYVFEREHGGPGAWGEVVKLIASDAAAGDRFGHSVAVSGDTVVVGANLDDHADATDAGSAYVFERDQGGPGAWGEVVKLTASDPAAFDAFGISVAVCGDTAVIGAPGDDQAGSHAGSAYVFERDQGGPGAWGEIVKLTASDAAADDYFGYSVAISGDTAVVGAPGDDHPGGSDAGSAHVFERHQGGPGSWGEAVKITASDAAADDEFGVSVAVSSDTAVIGAWGEDHAGSTSAGAGYVFERDQGGPGAWGEVAKLTASDGGGFDLFGVSVAVSGDIALVGAYGDDWISSAEGSAYVFERNKEGPGAWGEVVKLTASDAAPGDEFGVSVGISGDTAVVGANDDTHMAGTNAGSAYVYGISFGTEVYCTAGTSASGCQASISAAGTASATASSGFVLSASGVEGAKDGLFFFGTNGKQANPWGNGTSYQCIVPPVKRAGLLAGVGTVGACDGSFAQDLNAHWCPTCPKPSHNPGAGTFTQAQLWYRDPQSTSNQSTSLSDAIEFLVGP